MPAVRYRLPKLSIHHRTIYRYHQPVQLGPHRLMLRPRESRDLRLLSHAIHIMPKAKLSWAQDVAGNAVASFVPNAWSSELVIDSTALVEVCAPDWPVFDIALCAIHYPFPYSAEEKTDLGALTHPSYYDETGRLHAWAKNFILGERTDTLSLLQDISAGVSASIRYQSREDEGTQGPLETLDRGWGSCRDIAVLFVDAVRTLGLGARIVSGYLHDPDHQLLGSIGSGSTHAWAEVFVPGAGWITFDPTNRSMGGANLIPVAVVRDIRQAVPVLGSFVGMSDAYRDLSVEVSVRAA
jgi:transglutaminase-like putative cysteine protease